MDSGRLNEAGCIIKETLMDKDGLRDTARWRERETLMDSDGLNMGTIRSITA